MHLERFLLKRLSKDTYLHVLIICCRFFSDNRSFFLAFANGNCSFCFGYEEESQM